MQHKKKREVFGEDNIGFVLVYWLWTDCEVIMWRCQQMADNIALGSKVML